MLEFTTQSPEETKKLGERIAQQLKPQDVLALSGELGAGKTTFLQGLAKGLGIEDFVTSPAFIILTEHKGRIPFYHADLYRLADTSEIEDLGLEQYFEKDGILAIEWAEKAEGLLPKDTIQIRFEAIDKNERRIIINNFSINN